MASRNLYLGNIHPQTQTYELREIFQPYGNLERCELRYGGPSYSVAFGFVSYHSIVHAEVARRQEHGRMHRGRALVVDFAKTVPGQYITRHREKKMKKDDGRNRMKAYTRRSRSSSRHRDARRNRNRSRSPYQRRSDSKRHRSSSNKDRRRSSHSTKDRK